MTLFLHFDILFKMSSALQIKCIIIIIIVVDGK